MKKFFTIVVILAVIAAGVWFILRPKTTITNNGSTYHFKVEGGKAIERNGSMGLELTQNGSTYIVIATPNSSLSSPTCPSVAPRQERTITIEGTEVPLCLSPNGGIVLSPFQHGVGWHIVTMFSDGVPDYDVAANVFESVTVKD